MSRTIVITGGTSGIGLALKELFEKNGDTVFTFSIDENESPNHYEGSVSHEIKVNQVFNDIHEKQGTIDMLINCAGFGMSAITEIAPMEKIQKLIDVNFYGTLYCTRAALRYMNAGARIVNLSSAMALFPVPFKSIYGASKSAVLSLSLAMKMELAPAGIDVVAICPGDTKTNFTKNRIKEFETTERYGDRLKTATEKNDSKEDKRMDVSVVANQIYKLVNKKKTKPFYIIGGKYKFLYFLTRLTPKSLLINITGKKLGGRMVENPPKKTKKQHKTEEQVESQIKTPLMEEESLTTVNEQTAITEDTTAETTENSNTIAEETKTESSSSENTTISQEEAKNNISKMLSKISILNKPSAQKQEAENIKTEQVGTNTANPSEVASNTAEEKTPVNTQTAETKVIVEKPATQATTNTTAQAVETSNLSTTSETRATAPVQQTTEAQLAQAQAAQPANSQPTPNATAPASTKSEPVVSNIQFDEEDSETTK